MAIEDLLDSNDKRRLELTQDLRESLIKTMAAHSTADGQITLEKDEMSFLVKLIDGSDKAVLTKSKIKVEDKVANNQKEASKLISEVLARHTVKSVGSRTKAPELPDDMVVTDLVEGETLIGTTALTYDEFTK